MGKTTGGQDDKKSQEKCRGNGLPQEACLSLKMLVPSLSGNFWGHCRRDSADGKGSGMR